MVALDLIKGSLRLIGALQTGETPEASEANDCLDMLNQLMEYLSLSGITTWDQQVQTFNLVSSQSNYTIGTASNFATTKPITIRDAYVTSNGISYPVKRITQEAYDALTYKAQTAPWPSYFLYVGGNQTGNIVVYPVPNQVSTITFNIDTQFTPLATLADTILWPTGYYRMVKYLLALDIADDFDKDIPPQLYNKAMDARAAVLRNNSKSDTPISYDSALTGNGRFSQLMTGLSGGY